MSLFLTSAALLLSHSGVQLHTDYTPDRKLRVRAETKTEIETTAFSMERDGEPVEGRGGGGMGDSSTERVVVYVDSVVEAEDGAPKKVARHFEDVGMSGSMGAGDFQRDLDRDSPLEDETLILTLDGEDVSAELESGSPEDPAMLTGHHLELPLDALLPKGEVSPGDSWEPSGADLMEALMMDNESALFPRPSMDGEGGGGRGGGRGGFRGGFGGGGGTSFMANAEWEIEAELTDAREDVDGVSCAVIELKAEASGDLPAPQFGRGRDREAAFAFAAASPWLPRDNTYEIELEGKLYFSVEEKRPAKLELEGEFTLESGMEGEREGVTFSTSSTREGKLEIEITVEKAEL